MRIAELQEEIIQDKKRKRYMYIGSQLSGLEEILEVADFFMGILIS